ncbi:MAG: hypothetical protein WC489_01055 [Patescibacteria group bacterium]
MGVNKKEIIRIFFIALASCLVAYVIDQYYIFGRGFSFFFDILKL